LTTAVVNDLRAKITMQQIINMLREMGFGQYEARAYLALLQQSNITGYELAKNSGIPGSKIYAVLNKLVAKELIIPVNTNPKKYLPLPPEEIFSRFKQEYLQTVNSLTKKLNRIYSEDEIASSHIWNLTEHKVIMDKLRDCIAEATDKIYLSIWDEELDEIAPALGKAQQNGAAISIVHFGKKSLGLGTEYYHGGEHHIRLARGGRRVTLIIDDCKVILANFREDDSCDAAWTANSSLVLLAKDYIIHDIYTIRIQEKFGKDADDIFGTDWDSNHE